MWKFRQAKEAYTENLEWLSTWYADDNAMLKVAKAQYIAKLRKLAKEFNIKSSDAVELLGNDIVLEVIATA